MKLPKNLPVLVIVALVAIVAYVAWRKWSTSKAIDRAATFDTFQTPGIVPLSADPSGLILQA